MFKVYDELNSIPLKLVMLSTVSDPAKVPCLVVVDSREPNNEDLFTTLLFVTSRGIELNPTAGAEMKIAGYDASEDLFEENGTGPLKIAGLAQDEEEEEEEETKPTKEEDE